MSNEDKRNERLEEYACILLGCLKDNLQHIMGCPVSKAVSAEFGELRLNVNYDTLVGSIGTKDLLLKALTYYQHYAEMTTRIREIINLFSPKKMTEQKEISEAMKLFRYVIHEYDIEEYKERFGIRKGNIVNFFQELSKGLDEEHTKKLQKETRETPKKYVPPSQGKNIYTELHKALQEFNSNPEPDPTILLYRWTEMMCGRELVHWAFIEETLDEFEKHNRCNPKYTSYVVFDEFLDYTCKQRPEYFIAVKQQNIQTTQTNSAWCNPKVLQPPTETQAKALAKRNIKEEPKTQVPNIAKNVVEVMNYDDDEEEIDDEY